MAQYSLLNFSLKEKTHWFLNFLKRLHCLDILKYFNKDKWLEENLHVAYKEVPEESKKLIFKSIKDKAAKRTRGTKNPISDDPAAIEEAAPTGTTQVEEPTSSRYSEGIPDFGEDLSKRILFWHFITELSYYVDNSYIKDHRECNGKLMKKISRYMMYLLVSHPSLLSVGITTISFEDEANTLADTFQKFRSQGTKGRLATCEYLDEHGFGDNKKGVLVDAHSFMRKMTERNKKWKEIGRNWLELLAYAASKCKGSLHAQNLRFGGELLTHVWLLMAQFGLTEHFQTSEKPHIARLVSQ
ncbi:uncharacterized protein LOC123205687 [Mangifera indica]|uniref:uncharacterized protein LOC123205687 n=1 Tax=Mangifera indica TaxID=29780 RepID=UPI001CF98F5F|nr:uncharacterized protein LOC123205687 [Mangifera indica]